MLASKVLIEIRFACETLKHQDSKKIEKFVSKCDEIVLLVYFIS